MSLFRKPKCPYCGGKLAPTGYSFPYPQWRCLSCITANTKARKIKDLEERIKELEKRNNEKS